MVELRKLPRYEKGKPYRPLYHKSFLDEVKDAWGEEWGFKSVFGKIRKIMVCRPGEEQTDKLIRKDYQLFSLPEGGLDFDKLQEQHRVFVRALKKEGMDVVFLNSDKPFIGTYGIPLRTAPYTRETIVVRGGAVICRPAPAFKRGLEVFHAKKLMEIGCPILYTVHGDGSFEASNMVWIDDKSAILAVGLRSNIEGLKQVEQILRGVGVEDIHVAHLPGHLDTRKHQVGGSSGVFHLDMTFGMAYYKVAVLWPGGVGYDTIEWLEGKGVDIIEISDDELLTCAPNLLPLGPKRVLVPAFGLKMTRELRKRGIQVVEVDLSEFAKGGGGPTCLTLPLIRDDVRKRA